ncbi:enoyl-CoA hydratase/isomerase family protein [Arsenicibacter rosenii]|uniref:2-(1,2-epoxy-1,2-dihydrophenyl)acetyl-CoA isomerase n=1 Tax=Arsenicibacter rosenii TaxID=1750698 RepID=A0A1S2VF59_9BACT|nr:enoyl-CoA hydratase-related protein [Arsenicibacter rosenii]OIN56528.1 2-(1,2-epoxy-1,2-dihydrophenyl)acetyl-CoA isomerase [Arsenicibacter rosenii]
MYEFLTYELDGGICRITLNRPAVYNALSPGLIREITRAMEAAGADDAVRVVVLTGAGEKAFCSGADLKEGMASAMTGNGMALGDSLRNTYHPMIMAIRELPKPVIARINGVAAGAGCSLALACDVIVMADEAYLSQIFVNIGLMPDAGSTFFLPRLVGSLKAFELCSTGRKVYGPEAQQLGLVSSSVPAAHLDDAVDQLVQYYAAAPTKSIGAMKKVLNESLSSSLAQQLEKEADNQDFLGRSSDAMEGIGSFLMKRKPTFSGK